MAQGFLAVLRLINQRQQRFRSYPKRLCKLFDHIQADITLTVLNLTEIGALYTRFEGKLLLRPTTFVANLPHSSPKNLCKPHARKVVCGALCLYPL